MRFLYIFGLALALIVKLLCAEDYDSVSARRFFPEIKAEAKVVSDDYIEVFNSSMPLCFLVDHGGLFMLSGAPSGPYPNDILLDEFFSLLMKEFYSQTGNIPSYIYNWVRRDYVNPNRPPSNPESFTRLDKMGQSVYETFHQRADDLIMDIERKHGEDMGFLINLHTSRQLAQNDSFPYLRIAELGIVSSWNSLDSPQNSMTALYRRRGKNALIYGEGLPYLIQNNGNRCSDKKGCKPVIMNDYKKTKKGYLYPVLPAFSKSKKDNDKIVDPLFTGWFTVAAHGSGAEFDNRWQNGLDAVQIEIDVSHKSILAKREGRGTPAKVNMEKTREFFQGFVRAVISFLNINYDYARSEDKELFIIDDGDMGYFSSCNNNSIFMRGNYGEKAILLTEREDYARYCFTDLPEDTYSLYIRLPFYQNMPQRIRISLENKFTKAEFHVHTSLCPSWLHAGDFTLSESVDIVMFSDGNSVLSDAVMLKRLFLKSF